MKIKKTKGYLLVICHYMEEETYFYKTLDELLKDWDYNSLDELLNHYNCSIYEVLKTYEKGVED